MGTVSTFSGLVIQGSTMSKFTRRSFLKSSVAASAAFSAFTVSGTKSSGNVLGANDRIRHGVVGIRGRGSGHLSELSAMDGVDVTYLVDVDRRQFESRKKTVKERGGNTPTCLQDVREALEDENLDSISIATCNHTHALISIWALQAGKHVYVEKPLSHNIYEGRKLLEAAQKYGKVVQHGTQNRSSQSRANDVAAVHSGRYGKLTVSKGYCCKPRWSIGFKTVKKAPNELDFDLWLGPAPLQAYHKNLVHYNWHWFWDFGCGDTGNQGVHQMDLAMWGIKSGTLPSRVWSVGGRFGYKDQGQTPNTQLTVYEYGDAIMLFETRGLVEKKTGMPRIVANEYYTTEGMIRDGKFHPANGGKPEPVVVSEAPKVTPGGAFGSYIKCIRDDKPENSNAGADVGHYSSALCHLANIAYRVGETADSEDVKSKLGANQQVVDSFAMIERNLKAAGEDPKQVRYQLSRVLEFDPEAERFKNEAANALLSRPYRKPFVVPDKV